MMLCIFIQCSISIGKEKDTTNQSALWFFLFYITVPWGLIDFLMKIKKKGKMWFPYHRIVGSVRGTSSYCKNTTCCRKCIDILKKKKHYFTALFPSTDMHIVSPFPSPTNLINMTASFTQTHQETEAQLMKFYSWV